MIDLQPVKGNRSAMPQAWEDFKKITEFTFNSTQG